MNVSKHTRSLSMSFAGRVAAMVSPKTRQLLTLGERQGWGFRVLGQAPFPSQPVRFDKWLIVPAHQDNSQVPTSALERVHAIYAAGLRPKGFVVVHEAPKLLPAAVQNQHKRLPMSVLPAQLKSALKSASVAVGVLGAVLVAISGLALLAVAAVFLVALLAAPVALVMGAAIVDPILVAVTEDGYWVEIYRWWS